MYNRITVFFIAVVYVCTISRQTLAQERTTPLNHIDINKIDIEGNTVFSDFEIKQRVGWSKINANITLEELVQVKNRIEQLYIDEGFVSSGAFLPQQNIEGENRLTIKIIEGVLTAVEIEGLSRLSHDYIESRLPKLEQPLNISDLSNRLTKLEDDPLINQISGELKTSAPGSNILSLKIEESGPIKTQLELRNTFSPTIGSLGGTAIITHQNLLGFGDRLSGNYSMTEGLDRYGFEYSIPLRFNASEGRVIFSYNKAQSELLEEAISIFDIQADFEAFSLSFKQPVIENQTQRLALTIQLEKLRSETFVAEDISFPFVDGLEDGESKISPLRFGIDFSERGNRRLIAAESKFNIGLDIFDATENDNTGIDGLFWSWQGNIQLIRVFDDDGDWQIRTSVLGQLTPDQLLPLEQLTVGGAGSVRGYRRNLIVGDNAVVAVLEGQIPVVKNRSGGNIFIVPFADFGAVWSNSSSDNSQTNSLTSIGLQLNHQISEFLDTRIFYAVPLSETKDFGDTSVEQKWGFSISVIPLRF